MSNVLPNDLRALEFPDSSDFRVNPHTLGACPLHSFLGPGFGGQDIAKHFRT